MKNKKVKKKCRNVQRSHGDRRSDHLMTSFSRAVADRRRPLRPNTGYTNSEWKFSTELPNVHKSSAPTSDALRSPLIKGPCHHPHVSHLDHEILLLLLLFFVRSPHSAAAANVSDRRVGEPKGGGGAEPAIRTLLHPPIT